jgi:transcriptional regulator with AAA-type ATPase domain/predicted ATPase
MAVREQLCRLLAAQSASRRCPSVLVSGETGTGKGLVVRTLHSLSTRADGPFVDLDCAAIPETLLEAEVFGFERGAFTDARQAKPGLLQAAHGGTLFLDEIGLLPRGLQGKLLKAVEERTVRRLGSTRSEAVDVWIIAATSEDLAAASKEGRFREDLYHRLATITLVLPPLRERGRDILLLADHFLSRACADYGLPPKSLRPDAQSALLGYRWPGNVRELANVIERAALLSPGAVLTSGDLDLPGASTDRSLARSPAEASLPLRASLSDFERTQLIEALHAVHGNVALAAQRLGLPRSTLRYRIARLGLVPSPALSSRRRAPAAPPPTARVTADLDWEPRYLAFLRVDLADPTRRSLEMCIEKIESFGGRLEERNPEGIVVAFGTEPVEDAPTRAVLAAMAIRKAAGQAEPGRPNGVVAAIHVSAVRIGRDGDEVHIHPDDLREAGVVLGALAGSGQTIRLTSPSEQVRAPDITLISAETLSFVEGLVDMAALGPVPIKGLAERVDSYELRGPSRARSRFQSRAARGLVRFVGRERELDELGRALDRAGARRGQVVAVVGEPGVGKSRLIWEFTHSPRVQGWLILEGGAVSYGKATPYLPLADLLRSYFRIEPRDDAGAIREKVTGKLLALDAALEPALPAFLDLLDVTVSDAAWLALDPRDRRQRTLETCKRLMLQESHVQPLILVLEDLHWIDSETQAFLDRLVEVVPAARVLLLANFRPEYQHGWGRKSYYAQLRLDPLPLEGADQMLSAILGEDPTLESLKRLLVERTGGNPFFLEESVRALIEAGMLAGERGALRAVRPVAAMHVPATVQSVLAVRIDRLPPDDRRLLQMAAVIGKDVPFGLLAAVAERDEDDLQRGLAALQMAEFLYETRFFPDPEYTFAHSLTHEVAYLSLLPSTRQRYHERIACAIESRFPAIAETQPQVLARHYTKAGRPSEALAYLERAAQRAWERSANLEAIWSAEQALELVATRPESPDRDRQELRMRLLLGAALTVTEGYAAPSVERTYSRARELCDRVGEPDQLTRALNGLWNFHNVRGNVRAAQPIAEQHLRVANAGRDPRFLMGAHNLLGITATCGGEFARGLRHLEQVTAIYDRDPGAAAAFRRTSDLKVAALSWASIAAWALGCPDRAVRASREALGLARELSHPFSLTFALHFAAMVHQFRREPRQTGELSDSLCALAGEHGFAMFLAAATVWQGWARAQQRDQDRGIDEMRRGAEDYRATGAGQMRAYWLGLLAEAVARRGDLSEGQRLLSEARQAVEDGGVRFFEAELCRLEGDLALMQGGGGAAAAERRFHEALDVARRQDARSWELRAATSLASLWRRGGRNDEARSLLGGTSGYVTEGFDTPDLQDAKALLDALG